MALGAGFMLEKTVVKGENNMKIVNKPAIDDPVVEGIRNAIEHRATWFYLLLSEAKKGGAELEKTGRAAIYQCGCFHGKQKLEACKDASDLREFLEVFADETVRKVFEMEMIEIAKDKLSIDFHYCPLVAAWQKLGVSADMLPLLCDIAMEGDRGIVSQFSGCRFQLEGTIAEGKPVCKIRIGKE
jgi:hypothetical protein